MRFSWRARRPEPVDAVEQDGHDHRSPHEWNLWELERRARVQTGPDVPHEWAAMFRSLREVARASLATAYMLTDASSGLAIANQDNAYSYTNARQFLSTVVAYDNAGTLNIGTDINY